MSAPLEMPFFRKRQEAPKNQRPPGGRGGGGGGRGGRGKGQKVQGGKSHDFVAGCWSRLSLFLQMCCLNGYNVDFQLQVLGL